MTRNLEIVKLKMTAAAKEAGRDGGSVQLTAVSKTKSIEEIIPTLNAGQRIFGENKVQEASKKWEILRQQFSGIELHLIGALQTNKAREAVKVFDVIETLDRPKLARTLARIFKEEGKKCDLYIQINTGSEPQKSGILPKDADDFIKLCIEGLGLPVVGLMCIPPAGEDSIPHFKSLKKLASDHGILNLSMGMSSDYEGAIAHGATHIRVGTALFGARNIKKKPCYNLSRAKCWKISDGLRSP